MKYQFNKKTASKDSRSILKTVVLSAVFGVMTFGATGLTMAKEITSGGNPTGGGTTICSPVKSLSYKGDARVGETGLASIDINYGVTPCDKTIPVRVEVSLTPNTVGAEAFYVDSDALLSNRVTVFGVTANKSYLAKVTVYNRNTGEVLGSSQIFAAAVRKTGV
ncbi:MAG TPA: hypothetical protein PKD20_03585 [Candidatus Saccharibacteria bacterium]|jgi:hypothetical protein|nr:hypothetical protein [Candidatus Saccharibacteria bacterium]HMT55934.1 hypothetical protein [Candidatus Saccharibacteria bacterium]